MTFIDYYGYLAFCTVGTPISGPLLMSKALQLYPLIYPEDMNPDAFKAGTGWLKRFKDRHGIRALSVQGESLSAAADSVEPFKERLSKLMEEKSLTLSQVFNCDETGLYWKLMPNKTLVSAREKEAKGFKKPKERVTLMACANATGSIKLPLVFIHKSKNPRCFKNVDKDKLPVHYYNQKNSWMDSSIFSDWFKLKFVPQCRKALKDRGLPDSAVLLLDNAPSHPDVDLLQSDEGKMFCVYLPPNTTSLIQPMDQGILQNIKRCYKRDLLLRLLDDEVGSMNIAEFSKTLNIKDAVLMSAKSWSEVEASSIAKCWNKLLICSDDSNQDTEDAGDDEDINSILSDMEIPPGERSDWLRADESDPGYHEYTEEEIVSIAREENESEQDDDENDIETTLPTVSHAMACKAIQTVLTYLEQQPSTPMGTVVTLNGLLTEASTKRLMNLKQNKISDYFAKV